MSIHPSLRGANTLIGDRSVYTRIERLQKLMRDGKIAEEDSPYGLPKVRTVFKVKTKKVKAEDAPAAEGEADADAEAPAEGASE